MSEPRYILTESEKDDIYSALGRYGNLPLAPDLEAIKAEIRERIAFYKEWAEKASNQDGVLCYDARRLEAEEILSHIDKHGGGKQYCRVSEEGMVHMAISAFIQYCKEGGQ